MIDRAEQSTEPKPRKSYPKRAERPERIDIGTDVLVRNDVIAQLEGRSERDVNRGDKKGDPFVLIGGCKYRPIKEHQAFMAGRIQRLNPPRPARAAKRKRQRT